MCLMHMFYMQYKYFPSQRLFNITSQKKLLYRGTCMYAYVYLCMCCTIVLCLRNFCLRNAQIFFSTNLCSINV